MGQHWRVNLHVSRDAIEDNFGTFLDYFVVIEKVEEEKHVLMLILISCNPVPELLARALWLQLVVH